MKEVFKNSSYIFLSFLVFSLTMILAIWLPNFSFIKHTATSSYLTVNQKFGILGASLGAIETNFTPVSRVLTIFISILFSIDFSMIIYYFQKKAILEKNSGTGLLGLIIGLLGIGCASCGSVLLMSILGLTTTTAFISFLPLRGIEFSLISILILSYSIYFLNKKIVSPAFCETKKL